MSALIPEKDNTIRILESLDRTGSKTYLDRNEPGQNARGLQAFQNLGWLSRTWGKLTGTLVNIHTESGTIISVGRRSAERFLHGNPGLKVNSLESYEDVVKGLRSVLERTAAKADLAQLAQNTDEKLKAVGEALQSGNFEINAKFKPSTVAKKIATASPKAQGAAAKSATQFPFGIDRFGVASAAQPKASSGKGSATGSGSMAPVTEQPTAAKPPARWSDLRQTTAETGKAFPTISSDEDPSKTVGSAAQAGQPTAAASASQTHTVYVDAQDPRAPSHARRQPSAAQPKAPAEKGTSEGAGSAAPQAKPATTAKPASQPQPSAWKNLKRSVDAPGPYPQIKESDSQESADPTKPLYDPTRKTNTQAPAEPAKPKEQQKP